MTQMNTILVGSYSHGLVVLSIIIAILASYTALNLAGRITVVRGLVRFIWLTGGAVAMGTGIWSMHYVGMLAFRLPVPVSYDWPTVLLSLLAAIAASFVALFVVSRRRMGWPQALVGSVFMGGGIATMHYIGMEAMRLPAMCFYDPSLVVLSVILAVLISLVALWMTFHLREEKNVSAWLRTASAFVMGSAIPVMHYTGMAAARFTASKMVPDTSHAINVSSLGVAGVIAVTLLVLGLAVVTSTVDRRFALQSVALKASEQRYRQLVESAQAILWQRDVKTLQFTFLSQEAASLLGYPIELWLTQPEFWKEHIYPEDRELAASWCAGLMLESQPAQLEYRMVASSGRTVWLRDSARTVGDRGYQKELVGVMVDITQRKRAEEKLRASEERLRLLVEGVRDYAIFSLDTSGLVTSWNAGVERIEGYKAEEIIGRHFSCFYLDEDVRLGKPKLALKIAKKEGRFEDEGWRVRKDGTIFWANVVITALLDGGGNLIGFSKIARDLTERRRAEERTQELNRELAKRNTELTAVNRELESFSYSVSHDLRSPLRAIDGFSFAVLEEYRDKLDAEAQEYLRRVRAAAARMAQLIDDLLKLARTTRYEMTPENVDLSQIAEEIFKQLQQIYPDRKIEFVIAPEMVVEGDRELLRLVLENLIDNAWKFTSKTTDARIELGVRSQEGHDVYFIADNGAGFDMTYVDKLFGAFQRLHDGSEFSGTGIGLATVQRIIQRHGGKIWAESEVGRGATFYFLLKTVATRQVLTQ